MQHISLITSSAPTDGASYPVSIKFLCLKMSAAGSRERFWKPSKVASELSQDGACVGFSWLPERWWGRRGEGDTCPRGRDVCLSGGGAVKQKEEGKTQLFIGEGRKLLTMTKKKKQLPETSSRQRGDGPFLRLGTCIQTHAGGRKGGWERKREL